MNKEEAKQQIAKLVEKYQQLLEAGKVKQYNEAQTRNDFIEPLFEFLGWDMRNLQNLNEVTTEESISNSRVDLAFRINNIPVMFLEAKAMKVDLDRWEWAQQAINYSWNKGATWAILTDFEGIKVFNAEIPPKNLTQNLFFELKWNEYLDNFDQLWLLSKESFQERKLSELAEKWGKLTKRKQVGEQLFTDLMTWRVLLIKNFKKNNPEIDDNTIYEGVQKVLDRLIFIRTAEDRKIEQNILLSLVREWESSGKKHNIYKRLVDGFRWFDENYNSKLFSLHAVESWQADNNVFEEIIQGLYQTNDGYRYDFSAISTDILGGIYEQYLGHVQEGKEEKKSSKRKSQGIYYTPKYIVDYLVENTLGEILKTTKAKDLENIKVLDPACGSGSFLISSFDKLVDSMSRKGKQSGLFDSFEVLKNNIYGVDLDGQAIEIAKLNLLLRVLQQRTKLPTLSHNLRVGNSLVDADMEKLEEYFGNKWREQNPFNWKEEFPEVFKKGGFDVIVGNPPYGAKLTKEQQEYFGAEYDIGSTDTAILFIKKAFEILAENRKMGFIVPKALCFASNWQKIRDYIQDSLHTVIDCGKVWKEVKLEQVIFILKKGRRQSYYNSGKIVNGKIEIIGKVDKKDIEKFGFFLNGVNEKEIAIAKKIKENSLMLNDIATNQRGAILQKHISEKGELEVIGGAEVQQFGINGIKGRIDKEKIDSDLAYIKDNSVLVQNIVAHIANPIDHIKITAAVPENKRQIIVDTINQITLNPKYDPHFVVALLHSKLINWYAYRFIFGKAIRTMHFDNSVTQRLPIPHTTSSEQSELSKLAKLMLNLQKELQKTIPNTEKHTKIQGEIEKLDNKIDSVVYKLYNLTKEEIEIIEMENY